MEGANLERRGFVRANYPCKIIIFSPSDRVLTSHTENIGGGGIRVILEEELEISSIVGLEIYLEEEPIICKGRIVWVVEKISRYRKDYFLYDTGIEFYEIKEKDRRIIINLVEVISSKK